MSKVLGIDLGTTNSVVAVFDADAGRARVLMPMSNTALTPSIVAYPERGGVVVGEAARNLQVTEPDRTIYSIKRFMGRRVSEVANEEKLVPYAVVGRPEQYAQVQVGKQRFTPQQVSAEILRHLKQMAERQLGEPVDRAVITVPAYFNDAQRQATRDAGEIAGFVVERIINEPTAAALAYGLEQRDPHHVVIFDFGGGTFDLSVMRIEGGNFRVLGTHGDTHLGGDDFDQRIIDVLAEDFKRRHQIDLRQHAMALQRLKQAAQLAKAELSSMNETAVMIPYVTVDGGGPKHLEYTLTRERFEAVCRDLFDQLRDTCRTLMQETGLRPDDIDEVVLVGGSTRIPCIKNLCRAEFKILDLNRTMNPDEVVALGAATLGGVLTGELRNVNLMDVTSHSFGVENSERHMDVLIPKNTPIPASVCKVFSTYRDQQRGVDIHVLEGEAEAAADNRPLGMFHLTRLPKAPAGVPRIEVRFDIDANGVLDVSARDLDSGKQQQITVTGAYGLDDDTKDQLRQQTEQRAQREAQSRAVADLCHHGEQVLYDTRKWLVYNHAALDGRTRDQFVKTLDKLESAVEKRNDYKVAAVLRQLDALASTYRLAG